jgi:hypothetical protein
MRVIFLLVFIFPFLGIAQQDFTMINELKIGESYTYNTCKTTFLSGDLEYTKDSICIYRDSMGFYANYQNKTSILNQQKTREISKIESKLFNHPFSTNTNFLNYSIQFKNKEGYLGNDDGTLWLELI